MLVKQIVFLIKILFIFATESLLYVIFKDFASFIGRLTKKLASINILYVKLFQAIALNNNLIDDKINDKLLQFTDNAPWSYDDIRLEELINVANDFDIALPFGYEKPINAGMISLVFKGYKRDTNKEVIIKVKRTNIERQLEESISNLLFCMKILSFIPRIHKCHINEVVTKNIDIIRQQTNFQTEVDNMIKMKNNCKNLKYVKIPHVYKEVTDKNPNCIVMDFIKGETIQTIKDEDYQEFAKQVLKFGLVTTIVHGVAHGDLHSGNILFIKDEQDKKYKHKIGILDFGIIYELESNYKNILLDLLSGMFNTPHDVLAKKVLYSGVIEPLHVILKLNNIHKVNILNMLTEIITSNIQVKNKANQGQIYNFLLKLNNYLNKNEMFNLGLKPSNELVKTQLVLAMAHGVTLLLCKSEIVNITNTVINELFHTELLESDK